MSDGWIWVICFFTACVGSIASSFGIHLWKMRALRQLEASYRRFEDAVVRGDMQAMVRERQLQEKLERRAW